MQEGFTVVSLVHPRSQIGTNVDIVKGTAFLAEVVINNPIKIG